MVERSMCDDSTVCLLMPPQPKPLDPMASSPVGVQHCLAKLAMQGHNIEPINHKFKTVKRLINLLLNCLCFTPARLPRPHMDGKRCVCADIGVCAPVHSGIVANDHIRELWLLRHIIPNDNTQHRSEEHTSEL